jgi:hypothetical protein
MAQDNMVLFAKKLKLESNWNELFLENKGKITPEMSVLGDEIKVVIRNSSLRWLIRTLLLLKKTFLL